MKFITPITITDAALVSSTLTEADYPAWSAGTYAVGDRRILASTHSIYQRLVAGASTVSPDTDTVGWQRVGPTNKWAMFDKATGTTSDATDTMTVTIAPGLVRALALLDVTGNTVTVSMTNDGDAVYSRVVSLNTGYGVNTWETYFFNDIVRKRTVLLLDVPPYANGHLTITVDGDGPVSIGTVAAGPIFNVGDTRYGMSLGFIDYSVKTTDQYGATTVTERAYAKRMVVPFTVRDINVDEVMRRLELIRATAVVWLGARKYDSSIVYGYAKDAQTVIQYELVAECSLTIEGLI
jgi:hypothetical protein